MADFEAPREAALFRVVSAACKKSDKTGRSELRCTARGSSRTICRKLSRVAGEMFAALTLPSSVWG
ncbi:MAG: hypothetical protein WCK17_17245, partial [Verrucomicrobiota bacterium]